MVIMGARGVCLFVFLVLLAALPSLTALVSVMSVDLGSEWMKVAIVKPGVPMEIALNKESRRKTPTAVCLKEHERLFGDGALAASAKNPELVYRHLQSLLGKKHDNPQVALYRERFPEHRLLEDHARGGSVYFKNNAEGQQYTPVELLGMVLNYSRGLAQDFAETTIRDAVVTVPAFFNQAERRAVLQAAETAGLKVLQLINDNTAVALNYGVLRRKDIDSTPKNIVFYDMGAGSTTASVVTYQTVVSSAAKDSGGGGGARTPQMRIRGVGFDRTLGGFEMDLRLRDHLARAFNDQGKSKKDVRENPRAMAKLLHEAQRLKTVLSANADYVAEVEGLADDVDFKAKVSRAEFEALCADLFERVPRPVRDALAAAEMTVDEIDQVILVGGATRVPKVQEVLLDAVGKEELSKNINADEAAAMGAVYQAAVLSKSFKVKPFLVQEAAVFPVQVEYTQEAEDGTKSLKHNRHILFQRMAPYPQRKVVTFNHHGGDDFAFHINYGDLGFLGTEDRAAFGSPNLTTVKLSGGGVGGGRFQEHSDAESKAIKAHFNMDESGVLRLDRVESVVETALEDDEMQPTFINLGNKISRLFGGGSSEPAANATGPLQDEEEVPLESGSNETEEEEEEKKDVEKKANKSPKKTKVTSEDIAVELVLRDVPDPSADEMVSSKRKLQQLMHRDLQKQEREKILNGLEAFIFETHDKLYEQQQLVGGGSSSLLSEEDQNEQTMISGKLSEASAWMDERGYSATARELREKLSELKSLCKATFLRLDQERNQNRLQQEQEQQQGQGDGPSSRVGEPKDGDEEEGVQAGGGGGNVTPTEDTAAENTESSNHSEPTWETESTLGGPSEKKAQSENHMQDEL